MEFSSFKKQNGIRLTLESIKTLSDQEYTFFSKRKAKITDIQESLQRQIVSLTTSIGLILFLGFSFELPWYFTFSLAASVSVFVLKLKFKLIRVSKVNKRREPLLNSGDLVARVSNNRYEFFKVKEKTSFHYYLKRIRSMDALLNTIIQHQENAGNTEISPKETEVLYLHKKKLLSQFYKITGWRETPN